MVEKTELDPNIAAFEAEQSAGSLKLFAPGTIIIYDEGRRFARGTNLAQLQDYMRAQGRDGYLYVKLGKVKAVHHMPSPRRHP